MSLTIVKKRPINLMTLILAIPCKDRIVVAADGRTTDFDTGESKDPILKIFELTENSAILIAGNALVDKLDKYMAELIELVKAKGHTNIVDVANDVKEIIDRRNWAEWKDKHEVSHMEAIVAGFDGDKPSVYSILDNRQITPCWASVFGNWDDKEQYLLDNLSVEHCENSAKQGNRVAIEMLSKAVRANPTEIGRPFTIWHVLANGFNKLTDDDVKRLDERYNGSNEQETI